MSNKMLQFAAKTQSRLDDLVNRAKFARGFLNRVAYPLYQNFQRERWASEDRGTWPRLDPMYARRKLTRFAAYPGAGTKMMIATNTLAPSVIGGGPGHKKIVTDNELKIYTTVPYAEHADKERSFSTGFRPLIHEIKKEYIKYIRGAK